MIHACLTKLTSLSDRPIGLRDGYYVKGEYENEPTIGKIFQMLRYERNGISALGITTTSLVEDVENINGIIYFRTENSTYRLEPLTGVIP